MRFTTKTAIYFVYLVILAGGVVRCTGSGMGCPDWPKCFGLWVPPVRIEELPSNFVELYSKGNTLSVEFNVYKTWTEYINRLLGALLGVVLIVLVFFSLKNKSKGLRLFLPLAILFLTMFQGWLGSRVVATNLSVNMITIHMFIAFLILTLLIFLDVYLREDKTLQTNRSVSSFSKKTQYVLVITIVLLIVQILLGTQVREQIDVISKSIPVLSRNLWIDQLGSLFFIHRSYSLVLTALIIWIAFQMRKTTNPLDGFNSIALILLVIAEILAGIGLTYFGFPALVQPLHLFLASVLYGVLVYAFASLLKKG